MPCAFPRPPGRAEPGGSDGSQRVSRGGEQDCPIRDTAYSLLFTAETIERAREIIDAFVAGDGNVGMPFEKAPWGDWYGQVFDRFGVMWALNVEQAPQD